MSERRIILNTSQLILQGQIILTLKPTILQQRNTYSPICLMNTDAKILNKIVANWTQQYIERIIHNTQVKFTPEIQGWFNIWKSINVIHCINKLNFKRKISDLQPPRRRRPPQQCLGSPCRCDASAHLWSGHLPSLWWGHLFRYMVSKFTMPLLFILLHLNRINWSK